MIPPSLQSSHVSRALVLSTTSPLLRSSLYGMGAVASIHMPSSRTCFFWHRKTVRLTPLRIMYHRTLKVKLVQPSANKSLPSDQYLERRCWQLSSSRYRNCGVRTNGEGASYSSWLKNGQGASGRPDPEPEKVERKDNETDRDWRLRKEQEHSWQDEWQNRSDVDQYMREVRKRREEKNMRLRKNLEGADKYFDERMTRWQQRMETIRRWIDRDPYDAIFGFSNRLRMGQSVRSYALFGRAEPQQRPTAILSKESSFEPTSSKNQNVSGQAKDMFAKFSQADSVTRDEKSMTSEEPLKDLLARSPVVDQAQSATPMSNQAKPPELTKNLLKYDPVSNRMVRKNDEAFSHYGQDLDTAIDIPVKPPRGFRGDPLTQMAADDTTPKPPSVSDVLAELRQYKAQRLPESVDESIKVEEQAVQDLTPSSADKLLNPPVAKEDVRAELERSFSQMYSKEAEEANKSITKPLSQDKVPQAGTQTPYTGKILPLQRSDLHKQLESQTRRDAIPYIYRKLQATDDVVGEIGNIVTSKPTHHNLKETSEFDETESRVGYGISIQCSNLRRLLEIEDRRKEISRISAELRGLEELLRSTDRDKASKQDRYNMSQNLKREQLEAAIAKLEAEMKASLVSVTSAEESLKGVKNAEWSGDVFPLVFGKKPDPKDQEVAQKTPDSGVLEREVEAQKTAMLNAEEGPRETKQLGGISHMTEAPELEVAKQDGFGHKSSDSELVKEIRDIYEKQYGEITAEHRQTLTNPDTAQDSDILPGTTSPSAQTAMYTVLSYDSSTSEVTTTSFPGPVSPADKPIPLTVGLSNLSQPSKFLPHLRLLGNHGFTLITSTKNILVLRNIEAPTAAAGSESQGGVEKPNGKINHLQADSSEAQASNNPPEPIYPNSVHSQQLYSEIKSTPATASTRSYPASDPVAKRNDPVYSGRRRVLEPLSKSGLRKWLNRMILWTGLLVVGLYLGGLTAGMSRVVISKEGHGLQAERRSGREEWRSGRDERRRNREERKSKLKGRRDRE